MRALKLVADVVAVSLVALVTSACGVTCRLHDEDGCRSDKACVVAFHQVLQPSLEGKARCESWCGTRSDAQQRQLEFQSQSPCVLKSGTKASVVLVEDPYGRTKCNAEPAPCGGCTTAYYRCERFSVGF